MALINPLIPQLVIAALATFGSRWLKTARSVLLGKVKGVHRLGVYDEGNERDYLANAEYFVSDYGLSDDASGTITGETSGVGQIIWKARDVLRYILMAYDGRVAGDFITPGSALGSPEVFQAYLDVPWADHQIHAGYSSSLYVGTIYNYSLLVSFTEETTVDNAVKQVLANLPGAYVHETNDKVYFVNRILEPNPTDDSIYYGQLDYINHVLQNPSLSETGTRDIYTSYIINYAYDYRLGRFQRRAICDRFSSDDGFGKSWADTFKQTSTSPVTLCQRAYDVLGKERALELNASFNYFPEGAVAIGNHAVAVGHRPMGKFSFVGDPSLYGLLPGHHVTWKQATMDLPWIFYDRSLGSSTPWEEHCWLVTRRERVEDMGGIRYKFDMELAPQTLGTGGGMKMGEGIKGIAEMV